MAVMEEFPEKLGWGFANILVKGKAGLLICLYFPVSTPNCPASSSFLRIPVTGVFSGHWEGNNGTSDPCSPADPLVHSCTGSFTELL